MKRSSVLRALFGIGITTILLLVIASTAASGRLVSLGAGGPGRSSVHPVLAVPDEADRLVTWLPDAWHQERHLEPAVRVAIEAAYVRAWAALSIYQASANTAQITATFSGPARQIALAFPRNGHSAYWSIAHHLQLRFYALDGATVALRDVDAQLVRTVFVGGSETVVTTHEQYEVVMVLEDGYWRIRQFRRIAVASVLTVGASGDSAPAVIGATGRPPRAIAPLVSLNYLPSQWPATSADVLAADLDLARLNGITGLRVSLPYAELGAAAVTTTALASVRELLALAQQRGIGISLVLFGGLRGPPPADWAATDVYLSTVVANLARLPGLTMWDIADGPDSNTASASRAEIVAWVLHELEVLKAKDPATPTTVTWSVGQDATSAALNGTVDAVSFRWSGSSDGLVAQLSRVRAVASGRPIEVSLPGPTSIAGWSPIPHTDATQYSSLAKLADASRRSGASRLVIAQLKDTPGSARGVLRADGTAKPAAGIINGTVRPPAGSTLSAYAGSRFWRVALLVTLIIVGLILWRRLGRRWAEPIDFDSFLR